MSEDQPKHPDNCEHCGQGNTGRPEGAKSIQYECGSAIISWGKGEYGPAQSEICKRLAKLQQYIRDIWQTYGVGRDEGAMQGILLNAKIYIDGEDSVEL